MAPAKKSTAKKAVPKAAATKPASRPATGRGAGRTGATAAATKAAGTKSAATKAPATKAATTKATATRTAAKKAAPAKAATTKAAATKAARTSPAAASKAKASTARASSAKASTTKAAATKAAKAPARKAATKAAFDAKFLAEQRALLLEERATYTRQAANLQAEADSLAELREPGDVQFDEESGEGDTLAVERERDLALSARALEQIDEIDHALAKLDAGTYGICEVSGEPIPKARLQAIPQARERVEYKVGGFHRH